MKNPSHPGSLIQDNIDGLREEGINLGVFDIASCLNISEKRLKSIIEGRIGIDAEMAVRLSAGFKNTTPEFWLKLQQNYDLSMLNKDHITSQVIPIW